jgi:hypothetical protein
MVEGKSQREIKITRRNAAESGIEYFLRKGSMGEYLCLLKMGGICVSQNG